MKQNLLPIALVSLLCLSLPSCIVLYPRFTPRSAEVLGRVIDSTTGAPVPKATVSGASYDWDQNINPMAVRVEAKLKPIYPRTKTHADGSFRLRATYNFLLTKVFFAPCSGSIGDQTGTRISKFLIQASGYHPQSFAETDLAGKERSHIGTIKLIPLRSAQN
ncbi:hypothetical protein [Prosthecobacter sp.]|uniref:hypothetical protein n=1 Tax=Prosthecobacter sp. TaxID=1965333 RepID=UPI0037839973